MELPQKLRHILEENLTGVSTSRLAEKASKLSFRYRSELRDGNWHIADHETALAYVTTRLPATFAAVQTAMNEAVAGLPALSPKNLLDIGSGPGTAIWAASEIWGTLQQATAVEACAPIREIGKHFAQHLSFPVKWHSNDIRKISFKMEDAYDLVTVSYVLDELEQSEQKKLISHLWQKTRELLLIVEPGTTTGWQRILEARKYLLEQQAFIVAPCPHAQECPVEIPDWCHFSCRVARSRMHLQVKKADVPWEDEKFIYLAAARSKGHAFENRILAPVHKGKGKLLVKLCTSEGKTCERMISKREGDDYKKASRSRWGDVFP